MQQRILTETFANGMTLLAEPMDWVESAAFALLLPAGYVHDPGDQLGLSNLLSDMVQRGCGPRDSRQFLFDLENLGVDYSGSVGAQHTSFVGACEARNLLPALRLFGDMARTAALPAAELELSRQVCQQEVLAFEDDLARRVGSTLRGNYYGPPYDRLAHGTMESVSRLTLDDVRRQYARCYVGPGAILSVAGNIDWRALLEAAKSCFGGLAHKPAEGAAESPGVLGYEHTHVDSSQTHIAMAYDAVPAADDDYYLARSVVAVLSDGMSSRLFTQVREERGLCYTVDASYDLLKTRAYVQCYAATTTERAQETFDVMLAELARLSEGVDQGEVDRLKARFKSGLIMQQESSASRSSAMASQWYLLGRVKTLEEISDIIDRLTRDRINSYLAEHPPQVRAVATLGAQPLETHVGVS